MLFPDIDVAAGTVTFALWQPIILVALLVLLMLLAVYRSRWVEAVPAYVTASLALLSDGSATGVDADYDAALAALRRRLEIDRFGFLAQVLAGEGCSAASCEKFALFADTSRIGAHLKARTLENLIARDSASWPQPALTARSEERRVG